MIEYLPWSKKVLDESISSYKNGLFSILDLEEEQIEYFKESLSCN